MESTRLHDVTVGKFDQFKRVLANAGVDGDIIDVLNKKEDLARMMINWLKFQLGHTTVGPFNNADGSISLRVQISGKATCSALIEKIWAHYNWETSDCLRSHRYIEGSKRMKGGVYNVTLSKPLRKGERLKGDEIPAKLGQAYVVDLELLVALIPFAKELDKLGVGNLTAFGAQFLMGENRPGTAYLNLGCQAAYVCYMSCEYDEYHWLIKAEKLK